MKFLGERYGIVREWLKSFTRNGSWRRTREQFIDRFNTCECCSTEDSLNVHHIFPVRWYPQLELEPYNLITLCRKHHFYYGHLGNWKKWNQNIWQMAQFYQHGLYDCLDKYEDYQNGTEPDIEASLRYLKRNSGRIILKGESGVIR